MIDRNKIKKFLIRNSDYTIGVVIGFLISVFPLNQLFTSKLVVLNDVILYIPRKIAASMYNCLLCDEYLNTVPILLLLIYPLVGLFIAFLLRKAKSVKKPRKNK